MADEVYQENVYSEEKRFISFKEVQCESLQSLYNPSDRSHVSEDTAVIS